LFLEEKINTNEEFFKSLFHNIVVKEKYKSTIVFKIPNEEFDAEILFNNIEKNKEILEINNWAISQVSLEDIFIDLI